MPPKSRVMKNTIVKWTGLKPIFSPIGYNMFPPMGI